MVVSSAYKIGTILSFINLGKSFMNMRKIKGPKTEPCGTPRSSLDQVVVMSQKCTPFLNMLWTCCLSEWFI
jgi:hypothetical protein